MVGRLNRFWPRHVERNLNTYFSNIQMPQVLPGVGGGRMLKLLFDWYTKNLGKKLYWPNLR